MKRSTRLYILSVAHGKSEGINRAERRANAAKTAKTLRKVVKSGIINKQVSQNDTTS